MKKWPTIIALVIGAGFLIYGYAFHARVWHFTETVEVEELVEEVDLFAENPEEAPPKMILQKVEKTEEYSATVPEHQVLLEITRGGLEREEDGRLALTYEPSKGPPAFCPT